MLNSVNSASPDTNNLNKKKINPKALIGAAIGTAIPVGLMLKKQKVKNPLKLEYNLKDMVILSAASITSSTAIASIKENKETKEKKIKEGVFQFINSSFPAILSAGAIKFCEKTKSLNNAPAKIIATTIGIAAGMRLGVEVTNKITDPNDKHPDRKLTPKDCLTSLDDAIGALALAKIPVVQNLHFDKILPLVYTYCGYKAGRTN